jgi:hypothetical protein
MNKLKLTIVKLGHVDRLFDLNFILKWKSELFQIVNIQNISNLPNTPNDDFCLDQKYDATELCDLVKCPSDSEIAVGIMAHRFVDNFYMHRVSTSCVLISLYGIDDLLAKESISIENFILKQLYEIFAIKCLMSDISSNDIYSIVHKDTRGCIFDLNGDRQDIIYNTERPVICTSCKSEFNKRQIDNNVLMKIESELKRLNKPIIQRLEIFIRKYPLLSIVVSGLVAISLNLIASALWDLIKLAFVKQ